MKKQLIILISIVSLFIVFFCGCTSDNSENGSNDDSSNDSNNENWLESYTPVHSIGTGSDDFWIEFPSSSDNYGQDIYHVSWVNSSIDDGVVLFVVHKTGCLACKEQGELVISLAEKYSEYVKFYDIDDVYNAPEDIHEKAISAYLYDPNGSPGYLALTGVFTNVKENGEVKIAWHSWELDVEDSVMESWIKDAIYFYNTK
jgi:hypothetical protein